MNSIKDFQQALTNWAPKKLKEPAYISMYYLPGKGQNQIDLVSADYKGATELVRLNTAYFDKSLPAGTPQLIMIGADYDNSVTPDMKKKVKAWFDEIDYQKLQRMIK